MKQQRCHWNGSAGLRNQPRCGDDGAHGGANLRLGHGDDAIDKRLDVSEVAFAYALRAEAVGDGAAGQFGRPGDNFASSKLSAVSPASSGSMPKTLTCGRDCFTAAATPPSRPPPETGARTRSTSGQFLNDFKAAGSLAGDDLLVVVRRDDDVAVLAHQFFGLSRRSLEATPTSTISAPARVSQRA